MSLEMLPPADEALATLHYDVARKGDPIDALTTLRHNVGLGFTGLAGMTTAAWLTTTEALNLMYAVDAPVYALGTAAVFASVGSSTVRRLATHRSGNRESQQAEVRDLLGESVDVFRTGKRRKDRSTLLRWYGADGFDRDETPDALTNSRLIGRLGRLLDSVDETPISQVALATNWITSEESSLELKDYGTVQSSKGFVQTLGKRQRLSITDNLPDEPLLVTTPAACRRLLSELQETTLVDLRQYLVGQIRRNDPASGIPELYEEWVQAGGDRLHATAVTRRIQTELERTLSIHNTPENIPEKDEFGVRYQIRTHPSLTIRGDNVAMFDGYYDEGVASTRYQGQKSLLNYLRIPDIDTLLTEMEQSSDATKAGLYAKVALLLKLHDTGEAFDSTTIAEHTTEDGTDADMTLLERIAEESPYGRHSREKALRKTGDIPSVEYAPRHSRLRRALGATALVLLPTLVGSAGYFAHQQARATYYQGRADFEEAYHIPWYNDSAKTLFQQYMDNRPWATRAFEDTVFGLGDRQYDAENQLVVAGEQLGLENLFNTLGANSFAGHNYSVPAPELAYTKSSPANVGDVDPDRPNTPLYTITPYNGASSEGFWASEVDDQLDVNAMVNYPFADVGVSFSTGDSFRIYPDRLDPQPLTYPQIPPNMQDVQFEVATSFASTGTYMPILTKEHTAPVAVQLSYFDSDGNPVTVSPQVLYDSKTNTYMTSYVEAPALSAHGPVTLKYWLGKSTETINARGPLAMPFGATIDMAQVQAATKDALGLAPTASDDAVIAANKAKGYRLNPFASSNAPAVVTGYTGSYPTEATGAVATVGATLAGNPTGNCNTAAATYMFATDGMHHGENANIATGFLNEDGNNLLSVSEAHAVVVDESGNIIDSTPTQDTPATPPTAAPTEPESSTAFGAIAEKVWPLLALAGIGSLLYRRRRVVSRELLRTRAEMVRNGRHTPRAISALQHAEWQDDTAGPRHFAAGTTTGDTLQAMESHPVAERVHSLSGLTYKAAKQLLAARDITVSWRVRKAMKATLRHQARIATETTGAGSHVELTPKPAPIGR